MILFDLDRAKSRRPSPSVALPTFGLTTKWVHRTCFMRPGRSLPGGRFRRAGSGSICRITRQDPLFGGLAQISALIAPRSPRAKRTLGFRRDLAELSVGATCQPTGRRVGPASDMATPTGRFAFRTAQRRILLGVLGRYASTSGVRADRPAGFIPSEPWLEN